MTDLTTFRDHARAMSTAEHKPDCPHVTWVCPPRWALVESGQIEALAWTGASEANRPACLGCNPQTDRDLFARLADEIDQHLAPADDGALFT